MAIIGIIGIIILFCYALRAWTFFVIKSSREFTIRSLLGEDQNMIVRIDKSKYVLVKIRLPAKDEANNSERNSGEVQG
jgi:hypothetical protein